MSMPSLENLLSLNVTFIQSSQISIQPTTRSNMVTTQSLVIIGSEDQLITLKPNTSQAMPAMFPKSNQRTCSVNRSPKQVELQSTQNTKRVSNQLRITVSLLCRLKSLENQTSEDFVTKSILLRPRTYKMLLNSKMLSKRDHTLTFILFRF